MHDPCRRHPRYSLNDVEGSFSELRVERVLRSCLVSQRGSERRTGDAQRAGASPRPPGREGPPARAVAPPACCGLGPYSRPGMPPSTASVASCRCGRRCSRPRSARGARRGRSPMAWPENRPPGHDRRQEAVVVRPPAPRQRASRGARPDGRGRRGTAVTPRRGFLLSGRVTS